MQTQQETIAALLREGSMTADHIAQLLNVPLAWVMEVKK
jgi:hypothetical protein